METGAAGGGDRMTIVFLLEEKSMKYFFGRHSPTNFTGGSCISYYSA